MSVDLRSALGRPRSILCTLFLSCLLVLSLGAGSAQAQSVAKYGADFLAGGVGARALAMGGAQVGLTQ
ncbi:MAG: hypothetical protein GVY18_14395, partial [Bacteroidetes bacterium]|nr:hypothetical protein [Bacteroidota bacterium]